MYVLIVSMLLLRSTKWAKTLFALFWGPKYVSIHALKLNLILLPKHSKVSVKKWFVNKGVGMFQNRPVNHFKFQQVSTIIRLYW